MKGTSDYKYFLPLRLLLCGTIFSVSFRSIIQGIGSLFGLVHCELLRGTNTDGGQIPAATP